MRLRTAVWIALVATITPLAAAAAQPLADTLAGEAKADYQAGRLLFGDGDFAGAEIKFKSAYDKSGDARLLWNVAACEKNQRHYARTMAFVRRYLDTGGDLLTDADRAEARALASAIESLTVKLTIAVSEPGADVLVDDEKVGTSPLDKPLVADIGVRKIAVKKQGFKESIQSLPVGGSAEARVEVKLEPEVHEGKLTVTTQPGAVISIDGQRVASGRFEGKLRSGGHTLRVDAEGARSYQSEVVLADDENRSIDVPLEKAFVPPPLPQPPQDKGPGIEIGVSSGPGVKMHGDSPWMQTVRADVGWRAGWPTDLALYAEYGALDATGRCGTDEHGAAPSTPADLSRRVSFGACRYIKAGFEVVVHLLPAHTIDPWLGIEPGFRLTLYDYRSFDPLTGVSAGQDGRAAPALDAGLRVGIDWHPARSWRPWAIGPFGALVATIAAEENPASHDSGQQLGQQLPLGFSSDTHTGPSSYLSVFFGLRSSLAF